MEHSKAVDKFSMYYDIDYIGEATHAIATFLVYILPMRDANCSGVQSASSN